MLTKRKINHTNGHAVFNPASLTMLMILLTRILINLSMRVDIIEKIYPSTNNINIETHLRRQKEDYRIWKLGTVVYQYGSSHISGGAARGFHRNEA
jgi:hypothetical protein